MIVILKTFSVFKLRVETWIRVVDDLNGRHQQLYQEKKAAKKDKKKRGGGGRLGQWKEKGSELRM